MQEIETYIQTYFGIGNKDLSAVANLFETTYLAKDEYLVKQDQYTRHIHFVKSGYLRVFASNASGSKEVTQWLSTPGMFITDLASFIFDAPARWNIQALSDCELYSITREKYQSIGDHVAGWEALDKLFIAKCFTTLEERVFNQLSMSAEEKVHHLLEQNPEIFLRVPLQYIASMLGMTPETLSRIRRKMTS